MTLLCLMTSVAILTAPISPGHVEGRHCMQPAQQNQAHPAATPVRHVRAADCLAAEPLLVARSLRGLHRLALLVLWSGLVVGAWDHLASANGIGTALLLAAFVCRQAGQCNHCSRLKYTGPSHRGHAPFFSRVAFTRTGFVAVVAM